MAEAKISYFGADPISPETSGRQFPFMGIPIVPRKAWISCPNWREIPDAARRTRETAQKIAGSCRFRPRYWTPPLTPKLAYETEREQIENILGMMSLVSLTDHDNIDAPILLQTMSGDARTPVSVEWSVPFGGTVFHLGVHNLPMAEPRRS